MSELTKEYFEGYLEAKFNEKLGAVAKKFDLDNLAQMTSSNFERIEKWLAGFDNRLDGLRVDIVRLSIEQEEIKQRLSKAMFQTEKAP